MGSGRKVRKKRWFLDVDNDTDSHRNLIISFGPSTMFLEICMQIHSVVFGLSRQINKKKYAETINRFCQGNNVFVKYQLMGGFNPNPPLLAYILVPNGFNCLDHDSIVCYFSRLQRIERNETVERKDVRFMLPSCCHY